VGVACSAAAGGTLAAAGPVTFPRRAGRRELSRRRRRLVAVGACLLALAHRWRMLGACSGACFEICGVVTASWLRGQCIGRFGPHTCVGWRLSEHSRAAMVLFGGSLCAHPHGRRRSFEHAPPRTPQVVAGVSINRTTLHTHRGPSMVHVFGVRLDQSARLARLGGRRPRVGAKWALPRIYTSTYTSDQAIPATLQQNESVERSPERSACGNTSSCYDHTITTTSAEVICSTKIGMPTPRRTRGCQ
jgi:hypothetical protein